jgi:hypothetical protein
MAVNIKELQKAMAKMGPRSVLYNSIKKEIQRRGHWKAKPRGRPFTGPKPK